MRGIREKMWMSQMALCSSNKNVIWIRFSCLRSWAISPNPQRALDIRHPSIRTWHIQFLNRNSSNCFLISRASPAWIILDLFGVHLSQRQRTWSAVQRRAQKCLSKKIRTQIEKWKGKEEKTEEKKKRRRREIYNKSWLDLVLCLPCCQILVPTKVSQLIVCDRK